MNDKKKSILIGVLIGIFIMAIYIAITLLYPKLTGTEGEGTDNSEKQESTEKEVLHTVEDLSNHYHDMSIGTIDEMNESWKAIKTKEEMDAFAATVANDKLHKNIFASNDLSTAEDKEFVFYILTYIKAKYYKEEQAYPSIVCSKKEDFYGIAKNILNKDLTITSNTELSINVLDDYFCNNPGGDSSSDYTYTTTNTEESEQDDITTYKYYIDVKKEEELTNTITIEVKMKKIDDYYKLIYVNKIIN